MKAIIITDTAIDKRVEACIASLFESVRVLKNTQDVIPLIFMDPPDIILIEGACLLATRARVVIELRSNTIFGNLPIVALFKGDELESTLWQEMAIDDYLLVEDGDLALRRRLEFIAKRSVRELDKNPLTRLPGNESIIRHIQTMIDKAEDVALAWVDLDHFKPFNDRYGFSRGDEVLLATARIITNTAREIGGDGVFVAHIGGDDFVFICPEACVKKLCEEILHRFDMVIRNFYNDDDLENGGITAKSRDEKVMRFPIMTVSIAVVLNEKGRYTHYGQASQDATDIKKYIKTLEGSNYLIDRRGPAKKT
jgi:diguanylate cyclase (GGDEF)-like protein